MRALTLHQPWASLIADKRKTCETRSWAPALEDIGRPLAIHAAVTVADDAVAEFYPLRKPGDLPRGAVVAVAKLKCAFRVKAHHPHSDAKVAVPGEVRGPWPRIQDYPIIDTFGDWERGRWIWMLADVQRLPKPVSMRGWQGVWNIETYDAQKILDTLKEAVG